MDANCKATPKLMRQWPGARGLGGWYLGIVSGDGILGWYLDCLYALILTSWRDDERNDVQCTWRRHKES